MPRTQVCGDAADALSTVARDDLADTMGMPTAGSLTHMAATGARMLAERARAARPASAVTTEAGERGNHGLRAVSSARVRRGSGPAEGSVHTRATVVMQRTMTMPAGPQSPASPRTYRVFVCVFWKGKLPQVC